MEIYIAYAIALAFPVLLICVFIHDGITTKRKLNKEDARLERAIENAFINASRKRQAELKLQESARLARIAQTRKELEDLAKLYG